MPSQDHAIEDLLRILQLTCNTRTEERLSQRLSHLHVFLHAHWKDFNLLIPALLQTLRSFLEKIDSAFVVIRIMDVVLDIEYAEFDVREVSVGFVELLQDAVANCDDQRSHILVEGLSSLLKRNDLFTRDTVEKVFTKCLEWVKEPTRAVVGCNLIRMLVPTKAHVVFMLQCEDTKMMELCWNVMSRKGATSSEREAGAQLWGTLLEEKVVEVSDALLFETIVNRLRERDEAALTAIREMFIHNSGCSSRHCTEISQIVLEQGLTSMDTPMRLLWISLLRVLPRAFDDASKLLEVVNNILGYLSKLPTSDEEVACSQFRAITEIVRFFPDLTCRHTQNIFDSILACAKFYSHECFFECVCAVSKTIDEAPRKAALSKLFESVVAIHGKVSAPTTYFVKFLPDSGVIPYSDLLHTIESAATIDVNHMSELVSLSKLENRQDGDKNTLLLVERFLLPLLFSEGEVVREQAARGCLEVCKNRSDRPAADDARQDLSRKIDSSVVDILTKLLDVAVSDVSPCVRRTILTGLSPQLYPHLAFSNATVESLFIAVHDIDEACGTAALKTLLHLVPWNPGLVSPGLQHLQSHFVKEVASPSSSRCAQMLVLLAREWKYEGTLKLQNIALETLKASKCHSTNTAALQLLNALVEVGHVSECNSIISAALAAIRDRQCSKKRNAGVELLINVLRDTGIVQGAHLRNDAQISTTLCSVLQQADLDGDVRDAVIKAIGVVGAIDPARGVGPKVESSQVVPDATIVSELLQQLRPPLRYTTSIRSLYPSIALFSLLKVILNGTNREQKQALEAAIALLEGSTAHQRQSVVRQLIPPVLRWLQDHERSHLHQPILQLLQLLCPTIKVNKEMTASLMKDVLGALFSFCSEGDLDQSTKVRFVSLLETVAREIPECVRPQRWTVHYVVNCLHYDLTHQTDVMISVMSALEAFAFMLDDDLNEAIEEVLACLDFVPVVKPTESEAICQKTVGFLGSVAQKQPVKDCCTRIIHSMLSTVRGCDLPAVHSIVLSYMATFLPSVGIASHRYIPLIEQTINSKHLQNDRLQGLLEYYHRTNSYPEQRTRIPIATETKRSGNTSATLTFVSKQRDLNQMRFIAEMTAVLQLPQDAIHVKAISNNAQHQSVVECQIEHQDCDKWVTALTQQSTRDASELWRRLLLVQVETQSPLVQTISRLICGVTQRKMRREAEWAAWLGSLASELVRLSSEHSFRTLVSLTSTNAGLAKDMLPYTFTSFLSQIDMQTRKQVMSTLTKILDVSPHDVRVALLSLCTFLETERDEISTPSPTPPSSQVQNMLFTVTRQTTQNRFGINYEKESRGITVTKVAPGLPGEAAGVPVGAILHAINGERVISVPDITRLIAEKLQIQLSLECRTDTPAKRVPKPYFDAEVVARVAELEHFHAIALHYCEILFEEKVQNVSFTSIASSVEVVEHIIDVSNKLGFTREAKGFVKYVNEKLKKDIFVPEQYGSDKAATLEKLNWWARALELHKQQYEAKSPATHLLSVQGMMRCHAAMGEFDAILALGDTEWPALNADERETLRPLCVEAALSLKCWDEVDKFGTGDLSSDPFLQCVVLVHKKNYPAAKKLLSSIRQNHARGLADALRESESLLYDSFLHLQQINHLEEVMSYASLPDDKKEPLRKAFQKRLFSLPATPQQWKMAIAINSLVLTSQEDVECRLKFASICENEWPKLAAHILRDLLNSDKISSGTDLASMSPLVVAAYLKHMYRQGDATAAMRLMENTLSIVTGSQSDSCAWASCYQLLGEWKAHEGAQKLEEALHIIEKATVLDPQSYSAWHTLGMMYCDLAYRSDGEKTLLLSKAIDSLFHSLQHSDMEVVQRIQDTLRILTLWFAYGHQARVLQTLSQGISAVPVEIWLRVIPQLIARLGVQEQKSDELLTHLLSNVGKNFPHALIYPLTVCEKTAETGRSEAAKRVLSKISEAFPDLAEGAGMISVELVRIAILWSEKWFEGIQAAAKVSSDIEAVERTLDPLFLELEHVTSPNEKEFKSAYGQLLERAQKALKGKHLESAWQLLKQVHQSIGKNTRGIKSLQMSEVSPPLAQLQDCHLAVPGTFDPSKPNTTIRSFQNEVVVIPSKQKPRRFCIVGSDGHQYRFLLKGHEDLRLDERVMQLFSLVNTLFKNNSHSEALGLNITRYSVVPLSTNVGLIGWIEDSETIYKLIESHRQMQGVSIYRECDIITRKGNLSSIEEYHRLSKAERARLLQYCIDNTPSDELRQIHWNLNETCESWLAYRRRYAHSMGTMSIVGYILGLGDRHLNNLMMRKEGHLVHVDFGDCFEVAMHRSQFTECVPFRLTRLLVSAMAVTGVEGAYRYTCEHVMTLLRRYRESLLSVLETFVYDPLINWKLGNAEADEDEPQESKRSIQCAVTEDSETDEEWRELIRYISELEVTSERANEPWAPPAPTTKQETIESIKQAARDKDFGTAIRWLRYARDTFPELANSHVPSQSYTQEMHSICLQVSYTEKKNRVANSILSRIHSKLVGQDFSRNLVNPFHPAEGTAPHYVENFVNQLVSMEVTTRGSQLLDAPECGRKGGGADGSQAS